MIDTYKLRGLREKLVKELEKKGIVDTRVLKAIQTVPRHFFVESAFSEKAYEDIALPIQEGQTISQPYTVAYMTQLLEVQRGMKVLEIGTGSGYQCAILCEMGAKVFTIERHKSLYHKAKETLGDMGFQPRMKWGDGTAGWKTYAPFDRIIVTAGAPVIPEELKLQLSEDGGRMVIPAGEKDQQRMLLVVRKSGREFEIRRLDAFRFVPLIGRFGWEDKKND